MTLIELSVFLILIVFLFILSLSLLRVFLGSLHDDIPRHDQNEPFAWELGHDTFGDRHAASVAFLLPAYFPSPLLTLCCLVDDGDSNQNIRQISSQVL